jgi:hypothetical protein
MAARRLIPVLPLFLIPFGRLLERLQSVPWQLGISLVLAVATALPIPIFDVWGNGWRLRQVADERKFYPDSAIAHRRKQGEALGRAFRGIDTYMVMDGGLCVLAYYSELPRFMESNGLTSREIAKQKVSGRGLPGHEKPPQEWLIEKLKVTFAVKHAPPQERNRIDMVSIDNGLLWLQLVYWDEEVMAALRDRPSVRFVPIEQAIFRVKRRLPRATCDQANAMVDRLDHYYLRWHEADSERRAELKQLAKERCETDSNARSD